MYGVILRALDIARAFAQRHIGRSKWHCFEKGVLLKKVGWAQLKSGDHAWHHGEVFLLWNVVEANVIPHDNILVFNGAIPAKNMVLKGNYTYIQFS